MSNIAEGILALLFIAPSIMIVFCMAPRMLMLCEIEKHLRTFALYISAIVIAGIVAILVVVGSFCEMQRYTLFSRMVDYSYFMLCILNAISLLQLELKFGF